MRSKADRMPNAWIWKVIGAFWTGRLTRYWRSRRNLRFNKRGCPAGCRAWRKRSPGRSIFDLPEYPSELIQYLAVRAGQGELLQFRQAEPPASGSDPGGWAAQLG